MDKPPPRKTADNDKLVWQEQQRKVLFGAKIFDICESICISPFGETAAFSIIETRDWAVVMPVIKKDSGDTFLMVTQWRHGAKDLSVEFPGGVIEDGENVEIGAARELREETGCSAGKLTKLGSMSPNPAIMSNKVHFFLAEDLKKSGALSLDKDEFVSVKTVNVKDVLEQMGKPPYIHALMAAALNFYMQHKNKL